MVAGDRRERAEVLNANSSMKDELIRVQASGAVALPVRSCSFISQGESRTDGGVHPTGEGHESPESEDPRSKWIGVLVLLSVVADWDANCAAQCFSIGGPIGSLRSVMTGQLRAISALRAV